jgi:acetyl esterase/lipase
MTDRSLVACVLLALSAVHLGAEDARPSEPGGRPHVYKTVDGTGLTLWVRSPPDLKPTDRRPAAVFFHGGGWVGGPVLQFEPLCLHLASRGMVAVQVDYRLIPKGDKGPPLRCIQDARSAIRWVRAHAQELGIDPQRIAAGGGSAGGHLAAFVGMVDGLDDPQDDRAVSARSDAMLLFNPVFDNGPDGYGHQRMGERWQAFSPAHHISADDPPAIVFLGTNDKLIPVKTVEDFKVGMVKAGVRCETHLYDGREHGFFNKDPDRADAQAKTDAFLVSLGWLPPPP